MTLATNRKPRATKAEMIARRAAASTPEPRTHRLPASPIMERHKMYSERLAAMGRRTTMATPARVTNSSTSGTYSGAELADPATRIGADDFLAIPSRFGDVLRYRDGREVAV